MENQKCKWNKTLLSIIGTTLEHSFFRIQLFKNLQFFNMAKKLSISEERDTKFNSLRLENIKRP